MRGLGDYLTRCKAWSKNQTIQGSRTILQEDLVMNTADRTGHPMESSSDFRGAPEQQCLRCLTGECTSLMKG